MLNEIHVRDLALIEDVWLEFGQGMTVLTGETGAGKTALLGALQLLLGDRADSTAVRAGAKETLVEGCFSSGGEEIVARRRVSVDGRSRCQLSNEMATVGQLAQTLGPLVDLHGQHDHQALLRPGTHRGYLDRWIGEAIGCRLDEYRAALASYREAVSSRDELLARHARASADADRLRFMLAEIEGIGPREGEDEEIEARLPALQHAERLAEAAGAAAEHLRGEGGALDRVGEAANALSRVAGIDPQLDALAARLTEAATLVDDVGSAARAYRDSVEHDPVTLDQALSRASALEGLKRSYGPRLQDVLAAADDARSALAECDDFEGALAQAERRVGDTEMVLRETASQLTTARREAAPEFERALTAAVADLAMAGARFEVAFTDLPFEAWTTDGSERIEFLYAPIAEQPARPLAKIASGGEVSRVMLALKGVLGSADTTQILVFDEIDAGIGGATAHSVGRRLAQLASTHQVIVVTHLAQVAAYADRQLVVRRGGGGSEGATSVDEVTGEDRVAEVARMLSGDESDASLSHARELLRSASTARSGAAG